MMHALFVCVSLLVGCSLAQDTYLIKNRPGCEGLRDLNLATERDANYAKVEASVEVWQSLVMAAGFAVFIVIVSVIHKLLRKFVFCDAHLLDTFFDGGADLNVGLVACSVAAKWTWSSSLSWSGALIREYGLMAHFIFAAATAVPLFLFAIVLVEIRIKSPGAKTFLQVIRARFGAKPHIVMIVFALLTNLLIAGMVMSEGSNLLAALAKGIGKEVICIILLIVIAILALVGGVGGGAYVSYFCCVFFLSAGLFYFADVFYDPLDRSDNPIGSIEAVYNATRCGKGNEDNKDSSIITFIAESGFMDGLAIFFCSFSAVFMNQSFWQSGISAKPGHGVWGLLTSGLVWFAIPFCLTFTLGMAYWTLTLESGAHIISEKYTMDGFLPVLTSQRLLGSTGDLVMFAFLLVAVVTTVAGEVLAMSSIVLYDIYQTYIAPFDNTITTEIDGSMTLRAKRQARNEEYLVYNKRCALLKYAVVGCIVVLLLPVTLAILAIGIELPWLFRLLAMLVGSSVLPVALAVTWHRVTGAGVLIGSLLGLPLSIAAWLGYAATLDGGLTDFKTNTSDSIAVIIGSCVGLGVGGIACIVTSLCTGGCGGYLMEDEEWEKTRKVDNPVLPWTIRYAPDIGAQQMVKGKPHFYTVRRAFKTAEICAYIFGVVFSVVIGLVWPACMLLLELFSKSQFEAWTVCVLVVTIAATLYAGVLPLTWEVVQIGRQIWYNRQWAHFGKHERLHNEPSELSMRASAYKLSPAPRLSPQDAKGLGKIDESNSELNQTIENDSSSTHSGDTARWRTVIDIDS